MSSMRWVLRNTWPGYVLGGCGSYRSWSLPTVVYLGTQRTMEIEKMTGGPSFFWYESRLSGRTTVWWPGRGYSCPLWRPRSLPHRLGALWLRVEDSDCVVWYSSRLIQSVKTLPILFWGDIKGCKKNTWQLFNFLTWSSCFLFLLKFQVVFLFPPPSSVVTTFLMSGLWCCRVRCLLRETDFETQ